MTASETNTGLGGQPRPETAKEATCKNDTTNGGNCQVDLAQTVERIKSGPGPIPPELGGPIPKPPEEAEPEEQARAAFERMARRDDERAWVETPQDVNLGIISSSELLELDLPEPEWVVEGMIPAGALTFVVAPGGVGKSWLLLRLAETLSNGGHTFLSQYCEPCNVVFVDFELRRQWFRNRLRYVDNGLLKQGLITGRDERWDTFYSESPNITLGDAPAFLDRLPELADDTVTSLDYLRALVERTDAKVLIIDPIASLWGDTEENSASETNDVCKALRALAMETGAAVVVAHHTNKGDRQYRGSTAIYDAADAMYTITEAQEEELIPGLRRLETSKSRHSEPLGDVYLQLRWRGDAFTVDELHASELQELRRQQDEARADALAREAADTVGSVAAWTLNNGDLTEKLMGNGLGRNEARAAVERALNQGLIARKRGNGRGRPWIYAVNDSE
jgi:hypothetical protein